MPEPFKTFFNPAVVAAIGDRLAALDAGFDRAGFTARANDGLDALELKARSAHIARALGQFLPQDFPSACVLLRAALHPQEDGPVTGPSDDSGLRGWAVMPLAEYVATAGLGHFDRAMETLGAMTSRFTSEFAVRPFLALDPARGMVWMGRFAADPNPHLRRLASEGCRPRLPWGLRLRAFVTDPDPVIALVARLRDDPSDYVRRSVANNLNDIAKDHPDRVAAIARDWFAGAPEARMRLIRHACRTLVKQGHPAALLALGHGPVPLRLTDLAVSPVVAFGSTLDVRATLILDGNAPREIALDYVVHHRKANGTSSPKVFKWKVLTLTPGVPRTLERRHAMRAITTRRYHDGPHRLEIVGNGMVLGTATFDLTGT